MVTQEEIKTKTDADLLSIWANQHEYLSEMIQWVKAEIQRRQLDTSTIHVRTRQEIQEELALDAHVTFVRMIAFIQGACGILVLVASLMQITDAVSAGSTGSATHEELGVPFLMLGVSIAVITFAIGVWKRWRWAVLLGLVFYLVSTVINTVEVVYMTLTFFKGTRSAEQLVSLLMAVLMLVISAGLASAFNVLRKHGPPRK